MGFFVGSTVVAAVGLIPAALAIKVAHPTNAPLYASWGAFAGYSWQGDVRSFTGQWKVPALGDHSSVAEDETMLMLRGNVQGALIQLGTEEFRVRSHSGSYVDQYSAVWFGSNNTTSNVFGSVNPGDLVEASISSVGTAWKLSFDDLTRVREFESYTILNSNEAPSTEASWFQFSRTGILTSVGHVSIADVRVNGTVPRFNREDASWMSAPGGAFYAPSALRADAFDIDSIRLTRSQEQFLSDSYVYSQDARALEAGARSCGSTNNRGLCSADLVPPVQGSLTAAFNRMDASLRSQTWPTTVESYVTRLLSSNLEFSGAATTLFRDAPHPSSADWSRYDAAFDAQDQSETLLIKELDLPPPNPPVMG